MKTPRLLALTLLLVAAAFLTPSIASASHFRFGNLSWEQTSTSGQVEFTLLGSFRRSAYGSPVVGSIITETTGGTVLYYGDGGNTGTLRFLVTAIDPVENWVLGVALQPGTDDPGILHTYAGAGPYTAEISSCCRISSGMNNRANGNYRLATTVRPTGSNSSPVSSIFPIVVVPEAPNGTSSSSFYLPSADPDGDDISYRLSNNAVSEEGGGSHPTGLTVNSSTGEVTWSNFGLNSTNLWTVQIIVEDLDGDGNVMTQNPVDFLLRIGTPTGSAPTITVDPSAAETIAVGQSISFDVTGNDADAGAAVTLNGSGIPSGASLSTALPSTGGDGISTTFSWTPVSGQAGTYLMSFSATDENGQQATATKQITVINNTTPVANAGADQTVECTGGATALTLDGSGSSDADNDPLTYEWTNAANTVIGTTASINITQSLGSQTYTLTVDDGQATHSDAVTVTVADGTAPTITVTLSPTSLWPPNHRLRDIAATVTVSDNCSSTPTWTLTSITSNEAENGLGDGDTPDDIQNETTGTQDVAFKVRAERSGGGSGRIYTVTYTVSDGNGNSAQGSATVTVAHSNGKLTVTPAGTGGVALTGNQPNPFSESTTIGYMIPQQSEVSLTIYNGQGEIVRTLPVGTQSAGAHSTTWDGLDNNGRPAASGVYFCQLRAGDVIVLSTLTRTR